MQNDNPLWNHTHGRLYLGFWGDKGCHSQTHSFPVSAISLIFRKIQYKSRESKILKILMNKIFGEKKNTLGLPEYFLNINSKFLLLKN